jgi:hypothetical protein
MTTYGYSIIITIKLTPANISFILDISIPITVINPIPVWDYGVGQQCYNREDHQARREAGTVMMLLPLIRG